MTIRRRIKTTVLLSTLVLGILANIPACAGTVGAKTLSATPSPADFGSQTINTSSQKTITITNATANSVQVQGATLSGAGFSVVSARTGTLAPSQSMQVVVQFTPASQTTYSGALTVSATRHSAVTVNLSGTGIASSTSSGSSTSSTPVSVSVSPATVAMQAGGTQQFTASVSGTTNTGVKWLVNGVQGGNSTNGTISSSGMYQAPSTVATTTNVTVTADSMADTTKTANATVSVAPAPTTIAVTISPTSASVSAGGTQQFTANVTGTTNTSVQWLVNGTAGGSSSVGTISSNGLYTAPTCPSASSVTVTARSSYDSTKSASASLSVGASAASNSYYISPTGSDSNDGSACRPWATIGHADSIAKPGWTIHVLPGTYTQTVKTNASGTSTARVRWLSEQRWGAKIVPTGAYTVWTNNGSYVDIVGFDISGPDSTLGLLNEGSNVRILGNHVHNIPAAACTSDGGAGIDNGNYQGSNDDIIGNVVHDIGPLTTYCNTVHGIYHSNAGGHIWNNIAYRVSGYGIHLWHAPTGVSIANNVVFSNNRGGMVIGSSTSTVLTSNMTVVNNIVVWNSGVGIKETGSYVGTNNVYKNNIVYGNSSSAYVMIKGTVSNPINADPQFVNYQANGTGDYHLKSTSPGINAGTSSTAPAYDHGGGARPYGGAWDVGMYEFGTTQAAWPWY